MRRELACFLFPASLFQLVTGNEAPFTLVRCDSTKTSVSFVSVRRPYNLYHLPENFSVFSTAH